MKLTSRIHALCALAGLLLLPALGQLTVDVTGPVRQRQRNPTFGSGGSSGRRLTLRVIVDVHGSQDAQGRTYVDFILTNSGNADLVLPVSPHPGDLEPSDPKVIYTIQHLTLYLASERGPKGNKRSTVLPGGADLYGQRQFPETLTTLRPGESLKFLTRVTIPHNSENTVIESVALVGYAWLYKETVRPVGDELKSEEEEIGSASSVEGPSALFR